MAWGLPLATFTLVHVALSLIAIVSGCVFMSALLGARERDWWTAIFFVTTVATSVTGFGFPVDHLLPSHIVGLISLVVLAVAVLAQYGLHLRGAWRSVYVVGAAVALYLNVFVGVVQAFVKVSALHALAPHQTEPPFLVAQVVILAVFVILTVVATKRSNRNRSDRSERAL